MSLPSWLAFPPETVESTVALKAPGMARVISWSNRLDVKLTRDGKPAGGFFVYAEHLPLVAYASELAHSGQLADVGSIPMASGSTLEVSAEPGVVCFRTRLPNGELQKGSYIRGAELDALDRAIDALLAGGR